MDTDNILDKYVLLTINTINLFYFSNSRFCLPITLVLLIIYYKYSTDIYIDKKKLILVYILFSILTITGESIFIQKTNLLNYTNSDIFNVSSWLFSAYLNMVLLIYILNQVIKTKI